MISKLSRILFIIYFEALMIHRRFAKAIFILRGQKLKVGWLENLVIVANIFLYAFPNTLLLRISSS
jgi:hypothetical protein